MHRARTQRLVGVGSSLALALALAGGCGDDTTTTATSDTDVGTSGDSAPSTSGDATATTAGSSDAGSDGSSDATTASSGTETTDASSSDSETTEASTTVDPTDATVTTTAPETETDGTETDGDTETDGETEGDAWSVPACDGIAGAPGIGFAPDEGASVLPSLVPGPPGKTYTHGLVALPAVDTLVMEHAGTVYRSTDAGCQWEALGPAPYAPMRMTAGPGERAWAWSDNADALLRIDGAALTTLAAPTPNILGLGADPDDPERARIGDHAGGLVETVNGGLLWKKLGVIAPIGPLKYRAAFDPNDLDHVLFGTTQLGFVVTFDGGAEWQEVTFLGAEGHAINGFDAVISAADGAVVWALALDVTEADMNPDVTGRHIFRSEDGGLSFSAVVDQWSPNDDVILTNGTRIVAHPEDAEILYFVFGTCFSGYGTNLYRYHAGDQSLTWHNHPYADFGQIAVSPADPTFLYVGIDGDDNVQCP